ncbi:hypothetical protein GCM10028806_28640 [Spirosoma terrae]|uniref:Helix-turn-helix transcriptional regulator n=1 Tax=Spirosoma terrae TaxID=1968276 RepID=A0A6L9L991_9BACT|nr:hypothetical protein [Spirosoma terrae]NDU97175.1 hypothetical protein [Spirosoma terrae]
MLNPESEAINKRFFQAIDELVKRRQMRGKNTFVSRYGLNKGNFYQLRVNPDRSFELAYLTWLVKDYGVSSQWLLTGEGEMFSKRYISNPT